MKKSINWLSTDRRELVNSFKKDVNQLTTDRRELVNSFEKDINQLTLLNNLFCNKLIINQLQNFSINFRLMELKAYSQFSASYLTVVASKSPMYIYVCRNNSLLTYASFTRHNSFMANGRWHGCGKLTNKIALHLCPKS